VDRASADLAARSETLYHAASASSNHRRRHALEAISDDLTRTTRVKQQIAGPINKDDTGTILRHHLRGCRPPVPRMKSGRHDDGLVRSLRDGGKHWTNVTPRNCPSGAATASLKRPARCGAATSLSTHQNETTAVYLQTTISGPRGRSWSTHPGRHLRPGSPRDPRSPVCSCGAEKRVYVSFNTGLIEALKLNLPPCPFTTSSSGRRSRSGDARPGVLVLDDIAPLREFTDATAQEDVHLTPQPSPRAYTAATERKSGL